MGALIFRRLQGSYSLLFTVLLEDRKNAMLLMDKGLSST